MLQFERSGVGPNLSARRHGQKHSRYPWLEAYLRWIRAAAVVTFAVGIGLSLFAFIKGYNMTAGGVAAIGGYELMCGAVVASLASLFELVATFALTEFVRVVMDIEHSARAIMDFAHERVT